MEEDEPFCCELPKQKDFLCGLMSLAEGIKVTGVNYICAAFLYAYLLLVNLDKENAAIFLLVLCPRVVLFINTMRVDTKVSRRSYYISNVVCTAIWMVTFVIKVIINYSSKNPKEILTWYDYVFTFVFFSLQMYFTALSRSYWVDYQMHNSKGGYVEPSVDQKATLHKQLFGTNPDSEMAFDESEAKTKKSKVKTV